VSSPQEARLTVSIAGTVIGAEARTTEAAHTTGGAVPVTGVANIIHAALRAGAVGVDATVGAGTVAAVLGGAVGVGATLLANPPAADLTRGTADIGRATTGLVVVTAGIATTELVQATAVTATVLWAAPFFGTGLTRGTADREATSLGRGTTARAATALA